MTKDESPGATRGTLGPRPAPAVTEDAGGGAASTAGPSPFASAGIGVPLGTSSIAPAGPTAPGAGVLQRLLAAVSNVAADGTRDAESGGGGVLVPELPEFTITGAGVGASTGTLMPEPTPHTFAAAVVEMLEKAACDVPDTRGGVVGLEIVITGCNNGVL